MSVEVAVPVRCLTHEPHPDPFLTVRMHRIDLDPSLTAVCAGYESGRWRAEGLADHMIEWILDFALSYTERQRISTANSVAQMRRALKKVLGSRSTEYSGVIGELLLHIVCRTVFGSDTAISKVFFKTGINDEVKGFNCVHVVDMPEGLELWLGEAKCYTRRGAAISDAVDSIRRHLEKDYFRTECSIYTDLIDESWPHAAELRQLISRNASLDQIFKHVTVPVLIAYDSSAVRDHDRECEEFRTAFEEEMQLGLRSFADKIVDLGPLRVQVRLLLAPLGSKEALVNELNRRLPTW